MVGIYFFNNISDQTRNIFYSPFYIIAVTLIGIIGFVFKVEMNAILAIASIVVLNLIFQKDLLPSFLGVAIIGMVPLARYGEVEYFSPLYTIFYRWLPEHVQGYVNNSEYTTFINLYAPLVVVALIIAFNIRFLIYPFKFMTGRFFYATLLVGISVITGGFFHLSLEEYFSFPSLYYVIFLSIGMLIIYQAMANSIYQSSQDIFDYFSLMMLGVGIMGIVMVGFTYWENFDILKESGPTRLFQWRNNLSNNLLLSMPFAFYLSTKKRFGLIYLGIGILQFVALILSFSRGGIIFAILVYPLLLIFTFYLSKGRRLYILFSLLFVTAMIYMIFNNFIYPIDLIVENIFERIQISQEESRALMFNQAIERFIQYPVFGTGLAKDVIYSPQPMAMQWYHSTISQVIGSLGMVGIIAFMIQEIIRAFTIFEVKAKFNVYVLISIIGFGGYSLVNVGYFVPLPFVYMVLVMFLVLKRHNQILLSNDTLYEKEKIPFKFINGV